MIQAGQCAAFLEKALHAVAEGGQEFVRNIGRDLPLVAQRQRIGQIFLDRDAVSPRGHAPDRRSKTRPD
jgi:hypothetical protein